MAQLIIVTISIVMTSALAIIGLQYVGGPFIDGKDRAAAVQYMAQGAQIATAWKSWYRANRGTTKVTATQYLTQINWLQTGTSNDLVPDYLSALPAPALPVPNYAGWLPVALNNYALAGTAPNIISANLPVTGLMTWLSADKAGSRICRQIVSSTQGASSVPSVAATDIRPRNNAAVDCFYADTNGNSVMDDAESKIVSYRVF